jgi:hypothetical protein
VREEGGERGGRGSEERGTKEWMQLCVYLSVTCTYIIKVIEHGKSIKQASKQTDKQINADRLAVTYTHTHTHTHTRG